MTSIDKYSPSTNTWNKVSDIYDDRRFFCLCAFIDKIFIIGGTFRHWTRTKSCFQFGTKYYNWKEVAGMNEAREDAACAVFDGTVVVSGGWGNDGDELNTVEAYDVVADEWSSMPNMISGKYYHSLLAVRNKLFVIGRSRDTCEVFDKKSKNFVALKSSSVEDVYLNKAISVGSKILVFQDKSAIVLCYDVDEDDWSKESCEVTEHLRSFSCVKLPRY